jgi:hypothetical protein
MTIEIITIQQDETFPTLAQDLSFITENIEKQLDKILR